ncbi:MAG: hypothetical protein WCJ07_03085 [Verrucomicrobiota bacterium]
MKNISTFIAALLLAVPTALPAAGVDTVKTSTKTMHNPCFTFYLGLEQLAAL